MKLTKLFLGAIAGAAAGYLAVRTLEAAALLSGEPRPTPSKDARAYGRTRRALALTGTLRSALTSLAFAYGPAAPRLEAQCKPLPEWLRPGAYFGALALTSAALDAPIALIEDYALEHKYGLSAQPLRGFAVDYAKSAAIGSVVAGALGVLGGIAVRRSGRWWPLAASAGTLPLYVLVNLIVPLYILPLFNKFEPVTGALETRLRELAARFGVGDADILRMDMSRQTNKANAFVAGVGSTHRIVLGDTLIDRFENDEIEFVVAHELGHYVTRDTWRMIAVAESVTAALMLAAAAIVGEAREGSVGLTRIAAWLTLGMVAVRPAVSAFSRSREWAADRFALETTGDAAAGVRAFTRLRDQNLAENDVPLWYELLFASHPSIGKRIAALDAKV